MEEKQPSRSTAYLSGETCSRRDLPISRRFQRFEIDPDLEKIPRQKMDTLPVQERKSLDKEVELGFSKEAAVKEAIRCLQCHIFTIFDRTKCILCGGCVDICPKSCFRMARLDEIRGDEKLSALVNPYYGVPWRRQRNAIWPQSSSRKNPGASSAACASNDVQPVRLRWRSTIGNPPLSEKKRR